MFISNIFCQKILGSASPGCLPLLTITVTVTVTASTAAQTANKCKQTALRTLEKLLLW